MMSLTERARMGLSEMPSNAAWLWVPSCATNGRSASAAVVDAAPVGGDSVEIRMQRAREAAERAREARSARSKPRRSPKTVPTTLDR